MFYFQMYVLDKWSISWLINVKLDSIKFDYFRILAIIHFFESPFSIEVSDDKRETANWIHLTSICVSLLSSFNYQSLMRLTFMLICRYLGSLFSYISSKLYKRIQENSHSVLTKRNEQIEAPFKNNRCALAWRAANWS